jgi:hypothetical protein
LEKKKTVWSRQKAVGRIQKSEVRGQKTVSRRKGKSMGHRAEDRRQEAGDSME